MLSVNGEMFITTGAGLGAEFTIKEDLVAPFGLEFLVLGSDRGTHFALMWAATAVNPKSMAVRAGVKLMLPGAERIKATYGFCCLTVGSVIEPISADVFLGLTVVLT